MLTRAQFLGIAGFAAITRFISSEMYAAAEQDDAIEALISESFVMDGNVNLGMARGSKYAPLDPGAIKRLTGISAGNHTVRPGSLEGMNRRLTQNGSALLKVERARDLETAWRSNR